MSKEELIIGIFEKGYCCDLDAIKDICLGLLKENQELKKQLEKDKNKYIKKVEKLLANDIEPDPEDFYLAEIEGKSNDYDKLLNCQKEFKKWLEDKINFYKNRNSYMVSDIHGNYDLNQIELEFFEEVVKKYKEIIGVSDK